MSILALPPSTVRTIGSSQVLTDPSAVVKELVDNALDAGASIISVELHANTLDMVQVRDNGHGIAPQDRALVARRHCTSKITSEDELSAIGGTSLGFRGEALASAAEMSGGLVITTRVEGEQVATALMINQQGELAGQERASAPIGTTVRLTDFCKANPVRRQIALKQSEQCLSNVKLLLKRYAFARPSVRLSLKVLKAKNDKGNWMYGPKAGGNAEDAAFSIVGAACASQCIWSVVERHGFTVKAFLPRANAAANKISNVGAFLCIDGRPMNPVRGVAKQILKDFRSALTNANAKLEGVKSPFLYMDFRCPEQSYDVNIEPAKDDVLFQDPSNVVEAAMELLHSVYSPGGLTQTQIVASDQGTPNSQSVRPQNRILGAYASGIDFDARAEQEENLLPSRESTMPDVADSARRFNNVPSHDLNLDDPTTQASSKAEYRANMYGCDEEDLDALQDLPMAAQDDAELAELRAIDKDVSVSNPWVIAKMHARPTQRQINSSVGDTAQANPISSAVHGDDTLIDDPMPEPAQSKNAVGLLTPRAPSPRPARQLFHPSDFVPDVRFANDGRLLSSEPSDTERNIAGSSPTRGQSTPASSQFGGTFRPINPVTSSMAQQNSGTPLAQISQVCLRGGAARARGAADRPFVAPTAVGLPKERVWFEHLDDIENTRPRRPRRAQGTQQPQHELVMRGELGDLIDDPHPLTRPVQNRDIRDFVESVNLTEDHDAATARTRDSALFQTSRPSNSVAKSLEGLDALMVQNEKASQAYGALSGRGFMPASELATLEALGFAKLAGHQPPQKRRKTAERALRPTSGNAPPNPPHVNEVDDEYEPVRPRTKSGRRRSSVKLPRMKSSNLPLERTPAGKRTYDLALTSRLSLQDVVVAQRRCDIQHTLLDWSRSAVDLEDIFATIESHDEIAQLGRQVHELLINRVNDCDMVQDSGELIGTAIHRRQEASIEEPTSQVVTQVAEA
ncbi:hypothetical protein LTR95_009391 [Oleoguttula sp. CCFEE 5521]